MSEDIRTMKRDLAENYRYLEVAEAKLAQGNVPAAEVDEINKKARDTEELQAKVDQYERIAGVAAKGREIQSRTMPARNGNGLPRGIRTTPGHLFVKSEAFQAYRAIGKQGWSAGVNVKGFRPTVDLHGEEAEKYIARLETKDFPGAGIELPGLGGTNIVVAEQRDPDFVRTTEPEMLTIRDVSTVLPVTSDSVKVVKYTYTRNAGSQAGKGAPKPYANIDATSVNLPVETIGVLSKVSEQDIDDAPRLIGIINGEMRLDVRVEEERQLVWGDGTSNEIEGIFAQDVEAQEFTRDTSGTLIDIIRRMRTDLRKLRVKPNAVLIDPLDWESIELAKGTTNDHYLWGLISTLRGPMIWSLNVVESDAMENPDDSSRRILMGDFIRGMTIYDRHDVRLAVGYVDDDFARNLRTLRAEERLALGVKRAFAFTWYETAAGS